ncbi:MKI67 FHA domain-interacting nucleolar phosphoprotein [Ochlerotatus camptorhynchus]|uniref:MKI67 FHA domain-interacting nucleolar phosphoprotein n=1 Tax=Ochlerotatus camptorhynchus TaxID=644619 RepID=UPI0031D27700
MKNSSKMPAVAKHSRTKPKKAKQVSKKPLILSNRNNKRSPKKPTGERNEKGIIYVKHLPHGFFESQLRTFFCQFGDVIRVHVARSKKTLRSRGYAYVEFRYREVAQIASETMNNYLMFGKLLKTGLLPAGAKRIPRKYEKAYDANGNETTTYKLWLKKEVAKSNARVTRTKVVNRNLRALGKLKKLKTKYAELGVEYNVDEVVPDFGEDDLKVPEHDAEEAENQAKKDKKKAKQQHKLEKMDTSVLSAGTDEMSADSSDDDDEDASFLPLESTDWDVATTNNEDSGDEDNNQENQPNGKQTKFAALELANKTKARLDKEKKRSQKSQRPLVLRPPSSTDTSPEKPVSKKKPIKSADESLSQTEPESSPEKVMKGRKNKPSAHTSTKGKKVAGSGGVTKKPKSKKEKTKVQKNATSPVKGAAKALLKDPSVKQIKAKDIKKKKKKN